MKNVLLVVMTVLIIMLAVGTAGAETVERNVKLVIGDTRAQINGIPVQMSAPAMAINGSTLVPLRFVSEALGCKVSWEGSTRTAVIKMIDLTIEVPIGASFASINGGKTEVKVPAQIINGNTYIPLRFISENLGARVDYTATTKAVSVILNTFVDKENGFQVVIPAGWSVSPSYDDGIDIARNEGCFGYIGYFDSREGIDPENFTTFAERWFDLYEDKENSTRNIRGTTAMIVFPENGEVNIIIFKLLNRGVYSCILTIVGESIDREQAIQADIIMGTLTSAL